MNLLEDDLRQALHAEARRIDAPYELSGWIGSEVRRQRRRNGVVGAVLAIGAALAVSLVAMPLINADLDATYVAGPPDAQSGLLPWEPVGPLTEDAAQMESAVDAWRTLAPEAARPEGDVFALFGGRSSIFVDTAAVGSETVFLQAVVESGARQVVLLQRADASGAWSVVQTSDLADASAVKALVAPRGAIASEPERAAAAPAALLLSPSSRQKVDTYTPVGGSPDDVVITSKRLSTPGWELDASVGDGAWEPIDRSVSGYTAELNRGTVANYPASLAVRSPEGPYARGTIAEIADSSSLLALATGVVVVEVTPDGSELGSVGTGLKLAGLLGWPTDELTITDLGSSGAGTFGPGGGRPRSMGAVALERPGAGARIGAVMTGPEGVVDCWSSKPMPDAGDDALLITACHVKGKVTKTGRQLESTEIIGQVDASQFGLRTSDIDLVVDIERADGSVNRWRLGSAYGGSTRGGIIDDAGARVTGYTFRAVTSVDGPRQVLATWTWPGAQ
ncbi:MAG: hypothetical protein ABI720_05860 [Actinomycetes bacterium]